MVTATQAAPWLSARGLKHGEIVDGWLHIREPERSISIKLAPGTIVESTRKRQPDTARYDTTKTN